MPKKSKTNNQSVTKDDLKNFATKDDIKSVKDDIKSVKDVISSMAIKIIDNIEDLKTMKETVSTKDDIQRIISSIDSFGSQTKDHERTAELNTHRIKELEPKVENHEKRIGKLESHLTPTT
jgi:predicted RNase H-like nuclease (RuvC/YqgF family)